MNDEIRKEIADFGLRYLLADDEQKETLETITRFEKFKWGKILEYIIKQKSEKCPECEGELDKRINTQENKDYWYCAVCSYWRWVKL